MRCSRIEVPSTTPCSPCVGVVYESQVVRALFLFLFHVAQGDVPYTLLEDVYLTFSFLVVLAVSAAREGAQCRVHQGQVRACSPRYSLLHVPTEVSAAAVRLVVSRDGRLFLGCLM